MRPAQTMYRLLFGLYQGYEVAEDGHLFVDL